MKQLFAIVSALVIFNTPVFGANECNTTLKETDSYQNLSVILNCLSRKISTLETEVKDLKEGRQGSPSESRDQGKQTTIVDNRYLTIFNFKMSKKDDKIIVGFIVRSKYDQDLHLAYYVGTAIVTDEFGDSTGNSVNSSDVTGIDSVYSRDEKKKKAYTILSPGASLPVNFKFTRILKGKELSFNASLLNLIDETAQVYSVSKTGVRVEN